MSDGLEHNPCILYLKEDSTDEALIARALASAEIHPALAVVRSKSEFRAGLLRAGLSLILCDYPPPGYQGAEVLKDVREFYPDVPVVFISGAIGEKLAVEIFRAGANDLVGKDELSRLAPAVRRALREAELRQARQLAETELRASEQRLRIVFEYAPDAYYLNTLDGEFVDGNKAAESLIGYAREELLGKNFLQLKILDQQGLALAAAALALNAEGRPSGPDEFLLKRKDGTSVPVEIRTYPVRIQERVLVLGIARDITERKRASRAIEQNERTLRAILDNVPDPLWLKSLDGRYLACNESLAQFFGRKPEEVLGRTFGDLMPANASVHDAQDQRVLSSGKLLKVEQLIPDAEARPRWFETIKSPIFDEHGELIGTVGIGHEITERKQSEVELRASEELFRSVWEHSRDGKRLTDAAGRIIAVNEAYCRLVKLPRERLVGELLTVVYKDEPEGDSLAGNRRNLDTRHSIPSQQARVKFWNDEQAELNVLSSVVELGNRGPMVFSSFRNVTESRRAELRSTAFSRLGQRLAEAKTAREAGDIIVETAYQLLGWDSCWFGLYSAADDTLRHILNVDTIQGNRVEVPPASPEAPPSGVVRRVLLMGAQLILKKSPSQMLPDSHAFGDVSRPSASLMFAPVRHGAGVIGLLSIQSYTPRAYDQSNLETLQALADHAAGALARIQTQEALESTQQRLGHLLAESPAVIYSLKIQGNQVTLEWISNYVRQLLGFTAEETARPEWWENHAHPQDRQISAIHLPTLQRVKHLARDYRVRHKNGDYHWIRDEQRLVYSPEGQPVEIAGSWVDITERKGLEELLRQSQKMEAIGLLAGGVAHDFNNLLAVMRGNAELLQLDEDHLPESSRDCLKQIIAAAERSASLTRQLLAFSRKQVMQSQPLALNDVIANLTKMLKRVIGEHIELQCQYGASLPLVQADPGMMEQVLVNLLVNARDAMPRGGQLHISTGKTFFDEASVRGNPEVRAGEFVCLTVRDTGVGIASEHLPRIFEPFFTTKALGKGTGLGLATVYGIIKQHQGWIEVTSETGAGAAFKIFLPALPASASKVTTAQAEPPARGGSETILLVEDDYAVRAITRRMLESVGYKIHEAAHPNEALRLWSEFSGQIDLLLTDIVLAEGITGRDLAEKLRAQRPHLKLIFMSGYTPEVAGKDTAFFRRTKSFFVQKPCSARVLFETVRQCLDDE